MARQIECEYTESSSRRGERQGRASSVSSPTASTSGASQPSLDQYRSDGVEENIPDPGIATGTESLVSSAVTSHPIHSSANMLNSGTEGTPSPLPSNLNTEDNAFMSQYGGDDSNRMNWSWNPIIVPQPNTTPFGCTPASLSDNHRNQREAGNLDSVSASATDGAIFPSHGDGELRFEVFEKSNDILSDSRQTWSDKTALSGQRVIGSAKYNAHGRGAQQELDPVGMATQYTPLHRIDPSKPSCRCMLNALELFEKLQTENYRAHLDALSHMIQLSKHALARCIALSTCRDCMNPSTFTILLINICQAIVVNWEKLTSVLSSYEHDLDGNYHTQNSNQTDLSSALLPFFASSDALRNAQADLSLQSYEFDSSERIHIFSALISLQLSKWSALSKRLKSVLLLSGLDTQSTMLHELDKRVLAQRDKCARVLLYSKEV